MGLGTELDLSKEMGIYDTRGVKDSSDGEASGCDGGCFVCYQGCGEERRVQQGGGEIPSVSSCNLVSLDVNHH